MEHAFAAKLEIIGINPYVQVPESILLDLFQKAGKDRGPIPIHGTINGRPYRQTLVKYLGDWRLYVNTFMLNNSPQRIGENIQFTVAFDPSDRRIEVPDQLSEALKRHPEALRIFESLIPSRQKEIIRYIATLKSHESIRRNVDRAIQFLQGKGRFAGREKP